MLVHNKKAQSAIEELTRLFASLRCMGIDVDESGVELDVLTPLGFPEYVSGTMFRAYAFDGDGQRNCFAMGASYGLHLRDELARSGETARRRGTGAFLPHYAFGVSFSVDALTAIVVGEREESVVGPSDLIYVSSEEKLRMERVSLVARLWRLGANAMYMDRSGIRLSTQYEDAVNHRAQWLVVVRPGDAAGEEAETTYKVRNLKKKQEFDMDLEEVLKFFNKQSSRVRK